MCPEKVVVITHGQFHSFDLAEQLQDAGRLGAIFTGYPRFKLKNTRVQQELIHTFPWFVTPYLALTRTQLASRWPIAELGMAWRRGSQPLRGA